MTVTECGAQEPFLRRVVSLPVVTTALEQMTCLYQHTKDSNRLLRYALEVSETSVRVAADAARPVVSRLEKPIEVLNSFACSQLDKLEETYPIITEPTDKVYRATLKPTVDRIISIRDTGTDKIHEVQGFTSGKIDGVKQATLKTADGMKHYTVDTVNGVKERGVQKLNGVRDYSSLKLTQALQSPYGQKLAYQLNNMVDLTDRYVDHYLPRIQEEEEQEEEEQTTGLGRVSTVGNKVYRRLGRRLLGQLRHVQARSQDSLDKLTFNVNLIDYAKNQMSGVQDQVSAAGSKIKFWWEEIGREDDDVTSQQGQQTLEKRVLASVRHVTLTLKRGLQTISSALPVLPGPLRTRLDQAKTYTDQLYQHFSQAGGFRDISDALLTQVRRQIASLQRTTSQLTSYIYSLYDSLMVNLKHPKTDVTKQIEMEEMDRQKKEEEKNNVATSHGMQMNHLDDQETQQSDSEQHYQYTREPVNSQYSTTSTPESL